MKTIAFILFILSISILTSNQKSTTVDLLSVANETAEIKFNSNSQSPYTINSDKKTLTLTRKNSETDKEDELLRVTSGINFKLQTPVIIDSSNLDFLMLYKHSSLQYEEVDQWTLVALDDFQGSAQGWSKEKLATCGNSDNIFLGGHCNFAGDSVYKLYSGLGEHKMIKISATFHFFDMWEGEYGFMKFNNKTVWSETHKWCDKIIQSKCNDYGINVCGAEFPDRLGVPVEFVAEHSDSEFLIEFGSTLKKDPCIASWGIDNVEIYIK